ncbi:MAG: diphthine--ammonia ligase [Sulfolobales archaeon]
MRSAIVLYTGGKDSHYALLRALKNQDLDLDNITLVNIRSEREDLLLLHTINSRWVDVHANLMKLPMRIFHISGENELEEISEIISKTVKDSKARYIVSGVVASGFQKRFLDSLAKRLGVDHYSPLWGMNQENLLREEVLKERIEFIIVAAQAMGFNERWVGRLICREEDVEELIKLSQKYSFSPVGEGGEYESYVVASPLFKDRKIKIKGHKEWYLSGWGYFRIESVEIE